MPYGSKVENQDLKAGGFGFPFTLFDDINTLGALDNASGLSLSVDSFYRLNNTPEEDAVLPEEVYEFESD